MSTASDYPCRQLLVLSFKWKSRWKSSTHLSSIFIHPMYLHIDAKNQIAISPGCSYCRNSFLLKTETGYTEMILCPNPQPPKQKHIKGIKSFWILFHLHISFLQSNTPSCLNLLCDFAWLIYDSVGFGGFFLFSSCLYINVPSKEKRSVRLLIWQLTNTTAPSIFFAKNNQTLNF